MNACVLSCFSCVLLFGTLWPVSRQPPLFMGFSRQENWRGLPCLPPGGFPNPGIKPVSLTSPALASRFFTIGATWEAHVSHRDLQCMVMNATWTYCDLYHFAVHTSIKPLCCMPGTNISTTSQLKSSK